MERNQEIFEYIKKIRYLEDPIVARDMVKRQFNLEDKRTEEYFIEFALQS